MEQPLAHFDHPAWYTAVGTAVGWGLMLALFFVLFFVVPYLAYGQL